MTLRGCNAHIIDIVDFTAFAYWFDMMNFKLCAPPNSATTKSYGRSSFLHMANIRTSELL